MDVFRALKIASLAFQLESFSAAEFVNQFLVMRDTLLSYRDMDSP